MTGDGGFLMNVQELETAAHLHLPMVILVWTDQRYGVIAWKKQQRFGHSFGTEFTNPDFLQLAAAFGIEGFQIESADALLPTLQQALSLPTPAIIEVPVDYRENVRLFPLHTGITSPIGSVRCREMQPAMRGIKHSGYGCKLGIYGILANSQTSR